MNETTTPRPNRSARTRALLKAHWPVVAATAVAAVLLLWNLDAHVFWSDEALTAGYARSLLRGPLPSAWDGRNLLCYHEGGSLTTDLLATRYPLLQFYVVWPFFRLFGVSETTGRLPFALAGLLTVPLTYLLGLRLLRSRRAAGFSALLLALSVQFLLFARQCRYYALTILFTVLCLIFYERLGAKRWWATVGLVVSGLLLFHAHFLVFFCFMGGLTAAFFLLDRARDRMRLYAVAGTALLLLTIPWVLWIARSEAGGGEAAVDRVRLLGYYLRDMSRATIFPVLALPLLAVALWLDRKRKGERRNLLLPAVVALVQVILVTGVSIQNMARTLDADLRYVANLIPLCALMLGYACARFERLKRGAGIALCGVIAFSTLLSPWRPIECLPLKFARELADPYTTSTALAIRTLDEVSEQDDLAIVVPSRFDMRTPLVFYLGDKLRFAAILPTDSPLVEANPELPAYVYSPDVVPDYIVKFRQRGIREDIRQALAEKNLNAETATLKVYWQDQSRPELIWHRFEPVRRFPADHAVFILRVKKPAP